MGTVFDTVVDSGPSHAGTPGDAGEVAPRMEFSNGRGENVQEGKYNYRNLLPFSSLLTGSTIIGYESSPSHCRFLVPEPKPAGFFGTVELPTITLYDAEGKLR